MRMKHILTFLVALALAIFLAIPAHAGSQASGTSWKLTNDGGLAIWLTNAELRGQDPASNSTNNTIPAGALCVFNSTMAGGVQLAGNNSMTAAVQFAVAENSTHPGQSGWFVVSGIADVLLPMGMGATKGMGIFIQYFAGGLNWQYLGRCNATSAFNSTSLGTVLEDVTGVAGNNAAKAKALLGRQIIP